MTEEKIPQFDADLKLKLVLESDGKKAELIAGNIENIFLKLHSYGFEATLIFSSCNDQEVDAVYDSKKPTTVVLTFLDPKKTEPLFELKGFVITKQSQRVDTADNNLGEPLTFYKVRVQDNARATWEEHFPTSIYVNKSMKEALEQHKNPEITIKYDFPPLESIKPITAFSLPFNKALPKAQQPSFYSFINWYLHLEGGILNYDYKTHSYSIVAKKDDKGEAYKIQEKWITPPIGLHAPVPRFNTKIVTHTAQNVDAEEVENTEAYKSVRRDFMNPEGYTIFPQHAPQDVVSPLYPDETELTFHAKYFTDDFHIHQLIPGSLIGFPTDKSWTQPHQDKAYRVRMLTFSANKLDPPDVDKPVQKYDITCSPTLELKEETYIERPLFHPPVFPFEIHGKIFSDIGDTQQSTFKVTQEEEAPQGQYHVVVPLVGGDQKIIVPFTPNMPGHHFFPYTKDQEVLLAMYFRTALILRAINFQNRVRLPQDVQGKQIVLSYNGVDQYALMKHEFKDGKDSVVTIEQATSDKQAQTITIQDKEIVIAVETKDEKTILIKYSCEQGLFLSLNDKASKITQEIALDGKQITQTCKNDSDTNTIIQTPDTTTLTCKNFNLKADKVVIDAKEAINCKAGSKFNVEAPISNAKTQMKIGG
jgi:hypothetical protein